jgi:hypothetical protein
MVGWKPSFLALTPRMIWGARRLRSGGPSLIRCPADHFIPANFHLLTQLCRHIVEARRLSQLTRTYRKKKEGFNYREYGELLKAQCAQSLVIGRLSYSMRLTQQANFHQSRRLPAPTINNKPLDREEW